MLNSRCKGFTLLELIIALTITAVIVVIIFGALRIGIRAWEKGEQDVDVRQKQRIVLDLIKRQLASTCVSDWETEQPMVAFSGNGKSVSFISCIPMKPGERPGLYHVQYRVKQDNTGKENLMFYEKSIMLPDIEKPKIHDAEFAALLQGMESIVFEYLQGRAGEKMTPWQKTWDPLTDQGSPRAVRITLTGKNDKTPIYVIAAAKE